MKKKAFTLVEFLVVIAIIAILIAALLPALNQRIKKKSGHYSNQPAEVQAEKPIKTPNLKIGDIVVISGINKTGVVNNASYIDGSIVTIITTEGIKIENVDSTLLRKIYQ